MEIFAIFPLWLLTALLVLSMFCLFLSTVKSKRSSMVVPNLPPSPSKLHIIGNLHQLLGKPRHEALWQLSQKYGQIMQLHIGTKPYLVISSSVLAKDIFKTQDHIFCSRPLSQASKRLTYNYLDIVLSPYSNHWRKMRKLLVSELLGPKRARLFNHVLMTEIDIMVRSILSHPSNTILNLNKLFFTIVKGAVCKVAFGKNYGEEPLKGPSWEVVHDETMEILNGLLGDSFPWLGGFIDRFSGWNYKLEKCFTNIDAYFEAIFDDHHNHKIGDASDDDKDFLDSLLELSSVEHVVEDRLTKGEIKALIIVGDRKRSSHVGRECGEFYPERFENLDVDFGGGNFEMVPFGGGRRSCRAMNTAPATLEYPIANLLYWFDWEVPDRVKNEDLNMLEEGSLVLRKKLPRLVPKMHNWED